MAKKKITELNQAASFDGLVALGVDTKQNVSVQIPLQFVKDGADAALAAATLANEAAASASGDSVKVSPAQLAQLGAIDYSLLTEQVVPGEFWRSADGTKKQVYVRTFVGITSRSVLNAGSMDRKI